MVDTNMIAILSDCMAIKLSVSKVYPNTSKKTKNSSLVLILQCGNTFLATSCQMTI